jgi:hypothetical protein
VPLDNLFKGFSEGGDEFVDTLEGLEFEGEAGKTAELNPIGVTANSLGHGAAANLAATGKVGADSRKRLATDSLFTGEDEVFGAAASAPNPPSSLVRTALTVALPLRPLRQPSGAR